MKAPFLIETKANSSLSINGIYTPLSNVFDSLRRFVTPVYFYNGVDIQGSVEATPLGSSLNICYKNRNFKLTCRHIADNRSFKLEQIIHYWVDENGAPKGQTTGRLYGIGDVNLAANDGEDFVIAEFVDLPSSATRNFLNVDNSFFLTEEKQRNITSHGSVIVGFPLDFVTSDIDVGADDEIRLRAITLQRHYSALLCYVDRDRFDSDYMIPMQLDGGFEAQDPVGLSGSPVFNIYSLSDGVFQLGINGLLATANQISGRVNIFPARGLLKRLQEI